MLALLPFVEAAMRHEPAGKFQSLEVDLELELVWIAMKLLAQRHDAIRFLKRKQVCQLNWFH
jgi:hypothetical protein